MTTNNEKYLPTNFHVHYDDEERDLMIELLGQAQQAAKSSDPVQNVINRLLSKL